MRITIVQIAYVALLCFPVYQTARADPDMICMGTYVSPQGRTCGYCPKGYYKVADCTVNGSMAVCSPCGDNEFQPYCNIATSCAQCQSYCLYPHMEMVKTCSWISDMECRCVDGYYWLAMTKEDGMCVRNKACPAGEGRTKENRCQPCVQGETFSDSMSRDSCKPCTACVTYNTTCTVTQDAECSSITVTKEQDLHATEIRNNGWSEENGLAISLFLFFIALIGIGLAVMYCRRHERLCFFIRKGSSTMGGGGSDSGQELTLLPTTLDMTSETPVTVDESISSANGHIISSIRSTDMANGDLDGMA